MKVLKISKVSVLYEDVYLGKGVHILTEMEWKCYRMLKAIHGKDRAEEAVCDLIAKYRGEFQPPKPEDMHDSNPKYILD